MIFARCVNGIDSMATGHWTIEFQVVFLVVCKGIRKMTRYHTHGPDRVAGTVRARPPSAGQSVLVHGAAGAVGSMGTQLAREFGAYVIGTGRAADRQKALDFGAAEFVAFEDDALEDVGGVDLGVRRHRWGHPEAVRRRDSS